MTPSTRKASKTARQKKSQKATTSAKGEASVKLILDTVEKLMLDEGYAAVSSRRVAKEANLKPPLVHYYFPTTDDLFLAVFRRAAGREQEKLNEAVDSPASLINLWDTYCNHNQTSLAIEFMALANHRKAIRDEIATMTERERKRRAEILDTMLDWQHIQPADCSTAGLNVMLIGIARTLVMEAGLGITQGHDDARRFVEWWLEKLQKPSD